MCLYFGVTANILGDFILRKPICTHYNGFQVTIFFEDGFYKISLIKRVSTDNSLKIKYHGDLTKLKPVAPQESDYVEYIDLLKHFEALGGFNYGIKKIDYREKLELSWYIGKEIFQDLKCILSFSQKYKLPKKKVLSESNLSSIFLIKKYIPEALIPYNFYREASEYMNQEEYRQAYLHYYMILEYCFADGKTGQNEQIKAFLGNPNYILALLQTIKLFKSDSNKDLFEMFYTEVIELDKIKNQNRINYVPNFSLQTITRLLYDYRGRLAHGLGRAIPYIFNQKSLHIVALFIGSISLLVCGNMQVYASVFTRKKQEYVNKYIDDLKLSLNLS